MALLVNDGLDDQITGCHDHTMDELRTLMGQNKLLHPKISNTSNGVLIIDSVRIKGNGSHAHWALSMFHIVTLTEYKAG